MQKAILALFKKKILSEAVFLYRRRFASLYSRSLRNPILFWRWKGLRYGRQNVCLHRCRLACAWKSNYSPRNGHTLQTQKYYDWLKFQYAVQAKVSKRKITKDDVNRTYEDCIRQAIPSRPLAAGWFLGFADGESCFTVSIGNKYVRPQFIIGLHGRDRLICERIKLFLKCGIVYQRKDGVVVYQVSKLEELIQLKPIFYIAADEFCVTDARRLTNT